MTCYFSRSLTDYNDDKKLKESKSETPKSQEEKRKHIKTLIDKIPTDKASLFKYALDWSSVDNVSTDIRFSFVCISRTLFNLAFLRLISSIEFNGKTYTAVDQ